MTSPIEPKANEMNTEFWNRPLADYGLTSYRFRVPFGWIMIGAADYADAMNEAERSTPNPKPANLEVWNGAAYVPASISAKA